MKHINEPNVHPKALCTAFLAAAVLVVSACSSAQTETAPAPSVQPAQVQTPATTVKSSTDLAASPPVYFGTCSDVSGSVDRAGIEQFHQHLATTLEGWRPATTDSTGASPKLPALRLHARVIGTNSYGQGSLIVAGTIDGVPALLPEPLADPNETATEFRTRHRDWTASTLEREAEIDRSADEARALANAIRAYPIVSDSGSEQWGCLTALTETFGPGNDVRAVIYSDLVQTLPAQISGTLDGMHLLILQPCTRAAACEELQEQWSSDLYQRGAASVSFARPETAPHAITVLLTN